jgi:hypothetical protein
MKGKQWKDGRTLEKEGRSYLKTLTKRLSQGNVVLKKRLA